MPARVMVFIDYWNFQLRLNQLEARERGLADYRFKIDWAILGSLLARKACEAVGITDPVFEGCSVYTSFNPGTEEGRRFHHWATTWLGKQVGVTVQIRERKPKNPPRCPSCYAEIATCPSCNQPIKATVEKGVDTLIATDMIRLAWEQAYDVAILATSDADLIPAVEFLHLKARKVIQAGFPPAGSDLATACWASFDVFPHRSEFLRR
ncbi:MAG TPA: NYN domain-containing protein [Thermoanaerobaculia bacterium]|nr:NYN domain-containing protein [Thermoanaerobaculia bacterium]